MLEKLNNAVFSDDHIPFANKNSDNVTFFSDDKSLDIIP